jgi:hypothetical protein
MKILALLLLAIIPQELTATDHVDVAELNHFYDYEGRLVFDQVIFWNWDENHERYQVSAWRLAKNQTYRPERDWQFGGYVCRWDDGELIRVVRAESYRETWLQYDVELAERDVLPKTSRRELRKAEVTK